MNEKEFEKQQLEQLISDLKDIDKYTSFKNGAFIYDLGKYQGTLLINHINNLQSKIDKVNRILNANAHVENIYHALCNLFDKEYQYEIDNEELNKILKEDK